MPVNRWIRPSEDRVEWRRLLTGFASSAYRFEAQQVYSNPVEDARVADFVAGRPMRVEFGWRIEAFGERIASGSTVTTVRVVVEPSTDYTRMELATYSILTAAGEDVRVIVVPENVWPEELPRHDYWLFDDRDVWRMHYHDDRTYAGAEQLTGEEALAEHLRWRDTALALSIPLHEYPRLEALPT